METILKNPGPSISEDDLQQFEKLVGSELPLDYRQMLLDQNGGEPENGIFQIDDGDQTNLKRLYSLRTGKHDSLEVQLLRMQGILSPDAIAIGVDAFGNKVCLYVKGERRGQVWFWDHEEEEDTTPTVLLFVHRTYKEFIESLKAEPPDELDEIELLGKTGTIRELLNFLSRGNHIERQNHYRRTTIQEAARYGNIDLVRACIEHGARIDGVIHLAAMNRKLDIIDYLLSQGVSINERNKVGETPLSVMWDKFFADQLRQRGAR